MPVCVTVSPTAHCTGCEFCRHRSVLTIVRHLLATLCLAARHAWGQANPVFSATGPDAAEYGHEQNYPYGPPLGELVQMFMVGTLTHFDGIFPHHVVARGATAPLSRARSELALTYQQDGLTLSLEEYLR